MKRYLYDQILSDLNKKMVFVGGPRQVGKTTLARQILESLDGAYLNWDIPTHRERILKQNLPDKPLWCFDELHKFDRWRDFLKGLFDEYAGKKKILVTGSAHLDFYRYSGDSLQGRYHYLRLSPLSWQEAIEAGHNDFDQLLQLGGFPEPFLSDSAVEARRWRLEYRKRLIEEEVRSLERVNALGSMELLASRLPDLVGSPLSLNSLREDLQVSHKSVALWADILERLFHIFRIAPFGAPKIRAVKKEKKHYHYDWSLVQEPGARFENFVACHLLKWVQYQEDVFGNAMTLQYLRDRDQREVDFVITKDQQPLQLIECKLSAPKDTPKPLRYFSARMPNAEALVLCLEDIEPYVDRYGIRYICAKDYLRQLI